MYHASIAYLLALTFSPHLSILEQLPKKVDTKDHQLVLQMGGIILKLKVGEQPSDHENHHCTGQGSFRV